MLTLYFSFVIGYSSSLAKRLFVGFLVKRLSMEVKISTEQNIRCGKVFLTKNGVQREIVFPSCQLSTNAGCVPYLTQETFDYIPKNLHPAVINVPLHTVINHEEIFSSYPGWSGELMNIPQLSLMVVSKQDSLLRTTSIPNPGHNTAKAISIWGNSGRIFLNPEKHMELISTLKPDLFEALADGDTSSEDVSKKRVSKSYANSLRFLNESLKLLQENERLSDSYMVAPLEGGNSMELRTKYTAEALHCLKENNALGKLAGFLIDGLNTEIAITKDVTELVTASLKGLPQDKLRFIRGPQSPEDVFKLCECGIDIFDSSYPINFAQNNVALVFPLPNASEIESAAQTQEPVPNGAELVHNNSNSGTLDLSDSTHRMSFQRIIKDCPCYTCQNHTRAYIHHLISVRELLAPILLTLHNLHHYLRFFAGLRNSLKNGTYSDFKSSFLCSEPG